MPFNCSYRNKNEPSAIYPSLGYSPGELSKETIGHTQGAVCLGPKEVVTAVHNACIRELQLSDLETYETPHD
jgi:hypothetical protein